MGFRTFGKRSAKLVMDTATGKPADSEDMEQIKFVVYLQKKNILHYAVWNQGKKSIAGAIKAKRMGLVAGVPDICIPVARKGYHSLYIEMKKTTKSYLSEAQQYWIEALNKQGHKAVVAKGADIAIAIVEEYMS